MTNRMWIKEPTFITKNPSSHKITKMITIVSSIFLFAEATHLG